MKILKIKKFGDKFLKINAEPVEKINKEIKDIYNDMLFTMYQSDGVGLAATQIGINKRIIVVDIRKDGKKNPMVIINPEIIKSSGMDIHEEGCLSFPGIRIKIKRKKYITVQGLNIEGKNIEIQASDLLSRVFQHEIDHLNGILFIDRLSFLKKLMIKKEIKKRKRAGLW